MLIVHLASGLLIAIASALWGWTAGYSGLACLGLYVLGGNLGVAGGAAFQILSPNWRESAASR